MTLHAPEAGEPDSAAPELDVVLESMADAVITTDGGFRVTSWNRAAGEIYGWSSAEVLGRHVGELLQTAWYHPEERETSIQTLLGTGHWAGEVVQVRKDGQQVNITSVVTLLRDAEGRRLGSVAVNRDVTRERQAQAALAQVEERLTEVQRTDALGQLAGSVAHDFNNLLAIIGGHAELALVHVGEDHSGARSLQQILASVDRGATLTRQLLSFGRRDLLDASNLDLVELVTGIDEVLRRMVGSGNQLELDLVPGHTCVRASRGELEQVLINLCSNARDAMPRGGTVRIAVRAGPPGQVELEVADNGAGMAPAVRARAFEAFFTTKAPGHGTGLGLAVVSRVVSRYGGTVELWSETGRGTRVTMRFPEAACTCGAPAREPDPPPRSLRVLLAEDQELVCEVLASLLRSLGHEILIARNGLEAVSIGRSEPFDVLVTDVSMPGMSGPSAAAALRQARPDLPVVYISGFPRDEVARGIADWPKGVWRQKPVSLEGLRTALSEALAATR